MNDVNLKSYFFKFLKSSWICDIILYNRIVVYKETTMKIGLKEIIESRGETMKEVSDETGISQNTLSLLNQGKSSGIKFSTLEKLCAYLQCTPNDILQIKKDVYSVGRVGNVAYKKDGLVQVPLYLKPIFGTQDKAYLVVCEYWAVQFEQPNNHIFNITVGVPIHNIEQFEEYHRLGNFYDLKKTASLLQSFSYSKAEKLIQKIGEIIMSQFNNSYLLNITLVSSYNKNDLFCKGTYTFTSGDNVSVLPF